MKIYFYGGFLIIEDLTKQNSFPTGAIRFYSKETDIVGFVDTFKNAVIFEKHYTELTNEAGAPLGSTLDATMEALYLLVPVTNLVEVSNQITGFATSANQATANTAITEIGNKLTPVTVNEILPVSAEILPTINIPFDVQVARGLLSGWSIVAKSGRNPDIDTGSVFEDVWNGSSSYTGFPTTAPEPIQIVSSSASDTGTVTFSYLANSSSISYQTATFPLQGTTPVNTGITAYRVHTASYSPATNPSTSFNQGVITIRHRTTTANVFIAMPIGTNQSYMAGYTIPAGYSGLLNNIKWRLSGASGAFCDVAMWIRLLGQSPRLRRNNTAIFGDSAIDKITGGLLLPAGTDIMPRVLTASANNIIIVASYEIILIPNP